VVVLRVTGRGNEGKISQMQCPMCKSSHVHRERRTPEERWKYAAVFECYDCHQRIGISYLRQLPRLSVWHFLRMPWITFHVRCPRCGEMQLKVLRNRDYIEGYENNPLRIIQKLLGAKLYYCWECRLQFHDLRPQLIDDVVK
jgi:hypothetical protein